MCLGPSPIGPAAISLCGISTVGAELPLAGRHAVITGASRGIGAAIATRLAGMGAQTTLIGRDRLALEQQARRDRHARAVVCDVTNPEQVERAFAEARERTNHIVELVHLNEVYDQRIDTLSKRYLTLEATPILGSRSK